jgi:hypothetical protein
MKTKFALCSGTALVASSLALAQAQTPAAPAAEPAAPPAAAAPAAAAPAAPAAMPNMVYAGEWRISVDGGANSDGLIVFQVASSSGKTGTIQVVIKNGTGENNVAEAIRDAFKVQVNKEKYDVRQSGGETVVLKKKKKEIDDFSIVMVSSNVKGAKIAIEHV